MKAGESGKSDNKSPFSKKEFAHHQKRRKRNHDYRAAWKYHITITKAPLAPDFSSLLVRELSPEGVAVELSPLGAIIDREIRDFHHHHPEITVIDYIVMPDHIHLLIWVKRPLEKPVGNAIGGLKTGIANSWRKETGRKQDPVFEDGFNDRIIYSFRSLDDVRLYIRMNPYRLAVRRHRPDFFQKSRHVEINGCGMQGYGNLFLLRNPFKYGLVVHRADSDSEFEKKKNDTLYVAMNGGVVVSAFIAPREKEIRREVEKIGGRIILIHSRPFKEREKPEKHNFEQCCDGKLLMLCPLDFPDQKPGEHPSRAQCLRMNTLAQHLATTPA